MSDKDEEKEIKILSSNSNIETDGVKQEVLDKLKEVEKQRRELLVEKAIAEKLEEISQLEHDLTARKTKKQYVTSEPDKDGIIQIDHELAKKKIEELKKELENTKGFWARQKIISKISKINTAITTAKMNNGMIKTGKVVQKVGNTISTISESIGSMGKSLGSISGDYGMEQKPRSDSKTKRKGKKSKKITQRPQREPAIRDMGFTPENVFGDTKYDKYFSD